MKHKPVRQSNILKIKEDKIERARKACNRCGEGTFMAEHSDRWYCGKCKMTIWKTKQS